MASPPNFPKFGPTRATQPTAAQSGAGTGQLSPEEKAKVELMRQELTKNGITPEIQARFRMRAEKSGLWVVPGSSVDQSSQSNSTKATTDTDAQEPTQSKKVSEPASEEEANLKNKLSGLAAGKDLLIAQYAKAVLGKIEEYKKTKSIADISAMVDSKIKDLDQTKTKIKPEDQEQWNKITKMVSDLTPEDIAALQQKYGVKKEEPAVSLQNRPYRMKIGDKINSYQLIRGEWHQVEITPERTLKDLGVVKPYMISSLTTLKKKVDTQRASGNLTDWKINVATPILESMKPILKKFR